MGVKLDKVGGWSSCKTNESSLCISFLITLLPSKLKTPHECLGYDMTYVIANFHVTLLLCRSISSRSQLSAFHPSSMLAFIRVCIGIRHSHVCSWPAASGYPIMCSTFSLRGGEVQAMCPPATLAVDKADGAGDCHCNMSTYGERTLRCIICISAAVMHIKIGMCSNC